MPHMSELPEVPTIPPLTLGVRLGIAMRHAKISREQMAHHIGVDVSTISRWTGDDVKRPPTRGNLLAWAALCNVPHEWLIDGKGTTPTPPAGTPLRGLPSVTEEPAKGGRKRRNRRDLVYSSQVLGYVTLSPAA